MAEIIELLLFLCLLFTMNESALAAPIGKRGQSDTSSETKNSFNVRINDLEQKVMNLGNKVDDLETLDLNDLIEERIKNVTAVLEEQIHSLWIKLNQSKSSTISPTTPTPEFDTNTSPSPNDTDISPSPNDTDISPSPNDTNTMSSSNPVSTTSLSSNGVDDVSTPSSNTSNTLLGIVITIITVLMIGLLLYIAYQYRYQVYKTYNIIFR